MSECERPVDSTRECRGTSAAPITYAYLASVEHSGSTLLACLLGAHPDVSCVGEFGTDFPLEGNCSCGVKYNKCPFWSDWASLAAKAGIDFAIGNLGINLVPRHRPQGGFLEDLYFYQFPWKLVNRLRNASSRAWPRLHARAEHAMEKSIRLAQILCEKESTRVFLDTTKNSLQVRFLAGRPDIRFKLIALVRDGRGVMSSLMEKEKWTPEASVGSWLWGNRNLDRATAQYMKPEDVFRLRLEDFVRDSEGVRRALFRFLGVQEDAPLDYSRKESRHIVGNRMRHTFTGEIRQEESWKKKLLPEHLRLFEARAGWLNRRLGYPEAL